MTQRKRLAIATIIGTVCASGLSTKVAAAPCEVPSGREIDRLIFQLATGATTDDVLAGLQVDWPGITWTVLDQEPLRNYYHAQVVAPGNWTTNDWDSFVESMDDGGYPESAQWLEFLSNDEAPEGGTGSTFVDGLFDLSSYKDQYASTKLGLSMAHTRSTGVGAVVAVLDTGVDPSHPALASRLLPGWDFIDGDATADDPSPGLDADGDGVLDELAGHGTFTAGLAALVAPDARILPIRVLDSEGHGDAWTLVRGIWYAIDHGVEVINLSLGSTEDAHIVEYALEEAFTRGITVVAAAGNCSRSEPKEFPAMNMNGVIGVAAVDDDDVAAGFTNYHDSLTLSAPGVSVLDANGQPVSNRSIVSSIPGGDWAAWGGTSLATPLVSGAAALVRSQHPEWDASPDTSQLVEAALINGAFPIDALNPGYQGQLGAGRIDAAASTALGPVAPRVGDLDASGVVDVDDLMLFLGEWDKVHSSADFSSNGVVDIDDLLLLMGSWG